MLCDGKYRDQQECQYERKSHNAPILNQISILFPAIRDIQAIWLEQFTSADATQAFILKLMSNIIVRPYTPEDREQTFHVRAMTYNSGRPIPVEEQVYRSATPYVAEMDGRVVGTFVVMDMESTRGSAATWKTGGIAGVAVLPEFRQSGVGSAMMTWAIQEMRRQGYILASLYAFRESYYRRFGYENCGMKLKITCPNHRLPSLRANLPIRRLNSDQYALVQDCYEGFARKYSGMNTRKNMHWGRIVNDSRHIYAAGDPVEAYAIVEHDVAFWEDQAIVEVIWNTQAGYESILSVLAGTAINKTNLIWHEPSDSPFLFRYLDQGVKAQMDRPIMYRIINAEAAWASVSDEEFPFTIEDQILGQIGSGGLLISPQEAVQVFLGEPSAADLDHLRGDGSEAWERVQAVLPPSRVYCMDYF